MVNAAGAEGKCANKSNADDTDDSVLGPILLGGFIGGVEMRL